MEFTGHGGESIETGYSFNKHLEGKSRARN